MLKYGTMYKGKITISLNLLKAYKDFLRQTEIHEIKREELSLAFVLMVSIAWLNSIFFLGWLTY